MNAQHETKTPIETLNEFMEWVQKLESEEYLFRGLSSAGYDIMASAYLRLDPEAEPQQLLEMNKELIKDARLQRHDHRNGRELSDLEVLAELQHFRAATCLIDFTYSAPVALWFACQPTSEDDPNGKVSAVRNDPMRITEITLDLLTKDTELDHFFKADENGKYPLYRWQPSQLNNRIIPQHSVFLFGHDKIIKPDAECIIAADSKQEILESLRSFSHISDMTLFPDFDGFVRRRSHDIPYPQLSASEYYERGNQALQRDEYQPAINDYTRAIALQSDYADAYNNRGFAYDEIGEYQAAIKDYDKAIELKPDDAEVHNNKGVAYGNIGEYQAAIRDYDKAIALQPDYALAYYNKGIAYANIGEYQAAIRDYDKAIALQPDYALAYYNKGFAYDEISEYQAAIRNYDKAIELEPDYANAYNNRGIAYGNIGEYQAAIKDYSKAIELEPDYADAYYNRGIAYGNIGEYQAAIKDYSKAIELKPDYADAYNNRGFAYDEEALLTMR